LQDIVLRLIFYQFWAFLSSFSSFRHDKRKDTVQCGLLSLQGRQHKIQSCNHTLSHAIGYQRQNQVKASELCNRRPIDNQNTASL